jgi:hypothetical protein
VIALACLLIGLVVGLLLALLCMGLAIAAGKPMPERDEAA